LFLYYIVVLLKEDETCPDTHRACGEGTDPGGLPSVCGEEAVPDAGTGFLGRGSRGVSTAAVIPAYRRLLLLPWPQRRPLPAGIPPGAML
jgi:hypothetical protein